MFTNHSNANLSIKREANSKKGIITKTLKTFTEEKPPLSIKKESEVKRMEEREMLRKLFSRLDEMFCNVGQEVKLAVADRMIEIYKVLSEESSDK